MANVVGGNATERTGVCDVKHYFVLLSLSPHWIWLRPEIAVNKFGQISYEGSDWHGLAVYCFTPGNTSWRLTFNARAILERMQTFLFERIEDTHTFICLCDERRFNVVLIPKIVEWI